MTFDLRICSMSATGRPSQRLRGRVAVHPGVGLVVNNASVALGGTFEEKSAENLDWLFEINLLRVVRMTRAFPC